MKMLSLLILNFIIEMFETRIQGSSRFQYICPIFVEFLLNQILPSKLRTKAEYLTGMSYLNRMSLMSINQMSLSRQPLSNKLRALLWITPSIGIEPARMYIAGSATVSCSENICFSSFL